MSVSSVASSRCHPAPSFILLMNKLKLRKIKWFIQPTHMKEASIFQSALWPGVDFWMIVFKTHYKTQFSSSLCNSVNENGEEIPSSCWKQPSSVWVSSSQRSYLHFARNKMSCRPCLRWGWPHSRGGNWAVDTTVVRRGLREQRNSSSVIDGST